MADAIATTITPVTTGAANRNNHTIVAPIGLCTRGYVIKNVLKIECYVIVLRRSYNWDANMARGPEAVTFELRGEISVNRALFVGPILKAPYPRAGGRMLKGVAVDGAT